MTLSKFIFWFSLYAIFYSYLGYVLALWLIALFRSNNPKEPNGSSFPSVSLLISAYNEEDIIEEKLKNALKLDYPQEKLEIMVISDSSTDQTDEKVRKFSGMEVCLLRQQERKGKTAALNTAVPQASGEIIVFSDANSMYDRNAIKNLVKHFKSPEIGFVTGRTKYVSKHGGSVRGSTSLYNELELLTKRLESQVESCVGADGAIFAIRKELYKPLKDYDINDFVIPLKILEQGYRGILEDKAFCIEETARGTGEEFNRQVRITNRTIRAIFNNIVLLNPIKFPLFSFELISHKLLRFLLPFLMINILLTNCLIVTEGFLYSLILVLQVLYYGLVCWGYLAEKTKRCNKLTSMAYTFSLVSLAVLLGWIKYFSGETYSSWNPERTLDS
jgi:cellulose synthase/poly-beta-1,6-N-acetylglucosamine synthase-like glycosyltransferase